MGGEFDDEINRDGESLFETFIKNQHELSSILPNLLVYSEKDIFLKVSKLCPNLGLYMFKNLGDLFWYGNNLKKNKDKFLVSRFLKVEDCYFEDSEYYILECLTNINSVCVISEMLEDILPTQKAKQQKYLNPLCKVNPIGPFISILVKQKR